MIFDPIEAGRGIGRFDSIIRPFSSMKRIKTAHNADHTSLTTLFHLQRFYMVNVNSEVEY